MSARLAVLLALWSVSCAKKSPTPWDRAEVGAFQATQAFQECPTAQCIAEAKPCSPTHFTERKPSGEIDDWFRAPAAARCEVVLYADRSADRDGRCEVTKQTCRSLAQDRKGQLEGTSCAEQRSLYQAPECR